MPERRSRRAARVTVLLGLALFAVSQAGLSLAIDRWFPNLRDPLYYDKEHRLQCRLGDVAAPMSVVMIGSSRTLYGFAGQRLEPVLSRELRRPTVVFNFGVVGAGPITNLVYLKRLLVSDVQPDVVLIEVLPSLLAAPDPKGRLGPPEWNWLKGDRLWRSELSLAHQHGGPWWAYASPAPWAETWAVPAFHLRYAILSRFWSSWLPWQVRVNGSRLTDPSGWSTPFSTRVSPEMYQLGFEQAMKEHAPGLARLCPDGDAAAALEASLSECRAAGIPTAVVLMPESSHFRRLMPSENEARLAALLSRLGSTYETMVIDARGWVADDAFTDGHHMMRQGAAIFTDRLAAEAIRPLLTRTRP